MTFFLVNNKLPSEYAKKISEYGKTIRLPEFELMDFPVNSHPDMLAVNIGGKLFIHSENTLLANTLRSENIHFFSSSAKAGNFRRITAAFRPGHFVLTGNGIAPYKDFIRFHKRYPPQYY